MRRLVLTLLAGGLCGCGPDAAWNPLDPAFVPVTLTPASSKGALSVTWKPEVLRPVLFSDGDLGWSLEATLSMECPAGHSEWAGCHPYSETVELSAASWAVQQSWPGGDKRAWVELARVRGATRTVIASGVLDSADLDGDGVLADDCDDAEPSLGACGEGLACEGSGPVARCVTAR